MSSYEPRHVSDLGLLPPFKAINLAFLMSSEEESGNALFPQLKPHFLGLCTPQIFFNSLRNSDNQEVRVRAGSDAAVPVTDKEFEKQRVTRVISFPLPIFRGIDGGTVTSVGRVISQVKQHNASSLKGRISLLCHGLSIFNALRAAAASRLQCFLSNSPIFRQNSGDIVTSGGGKRGSCDGSSAGKAASTPLASHSETPASRTAAGPFTAVSGGVVLRGSAGHPEVGNSVRHDGEKN